MKLVTIVGARPQFIKAAAVHRAIRRRGDLHEVLVHTGQHFDDDMSEVFFRELSIPPPAHALGINRCSHGRMIGRMMEALEPVVEQERPDAVLVYGDTNSTVAGALLAAKLGVPVVHVEAGLRSFNRRMPEEINRVVTDHVSRLLLCPTRAAVDNLRREGIEAGVHHTGDVMYDAALHAGNHPEAALAARRRGLEPGAYAVATVHRQENTDSRENLLAVVTYLEDAARELPVLLPLHPRTRRRAEEHGVSLDGLTVCPPVGYLEMAGLVAGAAAVYTDSGGLQKEAYFHRVPCVTLRDETEWVETVAAGWNRLWRSTDEPRPRTEIADYGDGTAAERVVEIVLRELGQMDR
jgi:UDP-GlcNAc3NAcA epimerase